eukprot:6619699-Pyramimonas_sp.AAC.1
MGSSQEALGALDVLPVVGPAAHGDALPVIVFAPVRLVPQCWRAAAAGASLPRAGRVSPETARVGAGRTQSCAASAAGEPGPR